MSKRLLFLSNGMYKLENDNVNLETERSIGTLNFHMSFLNASMTGQLKRNYFLLARYLERL